MSNAFHPNTMDRHLQAALSNWPSEPRVYNWLALDARGRWRLQGEPVRHRGWNRVIGQNYFVADCGCWYYQHGKQTVYVDLVYTPWVYQIYQNQVIDHTGTVAEHITQLMIDEDGILSLESERGPGLIHDSSLPFVLENIFPTDGDNRRDEQIQTVVENLEDFTCGQEILRFKWQDSFYPVRKVTVEKLPSLTYFKRNPRECSYH